MRRRRKQPTAGHKLYAGVTPCGNGAQVSCETTPCGALAGPTTYTVYVWPAMITTPGIFSTGVVVPAMLKSNSYAVPIVASAVSLMYRDAEFSTKAAVLLLKLM